MAVFLQHEGRQVYVNGYCVVWGTVSHPHPMWGDRPGLFLPSAFDAVLKRPMRSLTCEAYHAGPSAILGSIRDQNLEVWKDSFGLAFRCGPTPAAPSSASVMKLIVSGETRGASTRITPAETETRMIDGEEVVIVKRIKTLYHLSPVAVPSDPATAVWLSTEDLYDMPPRIRVLAELLAASQPRHDSAAAVRKMTRAVAALPRRPATPRSATLKPRAATERRAAVPVAVPSIWPMGFGLSDDDWREFAFQEDVGRRAARDIEARKRARQRERNRAVREARTA